MRIYSALSEYGEISEYASKVETYSLLYNKTSCA